MFKKNGRDDMCNFVAAIEAICAACPDMGAALSFRCFVDITVRGSEIVMCTRHPISILKDNDGNYLSVIELKK